MSDGSTITRSPLDEQISNLVVKEGMKRRKRGSNFGWSGAAGFIIRKSYTCTKTALEYFFQDSTNRILFELGACHQVDWQRWFQMCHT